MTLIDTSQFLTLAVLGRGNHPVLKVQSIESSQLFALKKVLREEFAHHQTDLQELSILAGLNHPNIVKIHGFETKQITAKTSKRQGFALYILMELLGKTLAEEVIQRRARLTYYQPEEVGDILVGLVDALEYLHEKNVAHRDLKPENLMRREDGTLALTDFNDSFRLTAIRPEAKTIVGSPYYMSPELRKAYAQGEDLCSDNYDVFKSDIWSLGMTLLDIATLSIGDEKPIKDRLVSVGRRYGEKLKSLISFALEPDFKKRPSIKEIKSKVSELWISSLDEIAQDFPDIEQPNPREFALASQIHELLLSNNSSKARSLTSRQRIKVSKALQRLCELESDNKKLKDKLKLKIESEIRNQKFEKSVKEPPPPKMAERSLLRRLTGLFCTPG